MVLELRPMQVAPGPTVFDDQLFLATTGATNDAAGHFEQDRDQGGEEADDDRRFVEAGNRHDAFSLATGDIGV
jgi:hypothetical protein